MRDIYPKWIIEDGLVKIGNCTFHKELCNKRENVIGGGWFRLDKDLNILTFYAKSEDFGTVTFEQFLEAKNNGPARRSFMKLFTDFEWRFSQENEVSKALENYKIV